MDDNAAAEAELYGTAEDAEAELYGTAEDLERERFSAPPKPKPKHRPRPPKRVAEPWEARRRQYLRETGRKAT